MSNNLYKTFKTDEASEKEGVWLNLGPVNDEPDSPEMKLKLARSGGSNIKFQKRREVLLKPYRHQIQNNIDLPEKVADEILRRLYAETVVVAWENIPNEAGDMRPFTVEQVMEVFAELPQLFLTVRQYSDQQELYRAELREVDAKN